MTDNSIDMEKLQKQIEYYFSDDNLKEDAFFHRAISSTEDGFVPLELLLKCNRIIKLNVSVENIQACVERSSLIELSPSKDKLRRKDNSLLPPLSAHNVSILLESEQVLPDSNAIKSRIYSFSTTGSLGSAPELRRALNKALGFNVAFVRAGKQSGEFLCEATQKVETGPVRAGRWRITIQQLSEEDAHKWLSQHRMAAEKALGGTLAKRKNFIQGPVKITGRIFKSLDNLRDHLKLIINRTADGGKLSEEDSGLVKEILKYHDDASKAQAEGEIIVDKHPDFSNTRCFFILKKDGAREDFSFHKCLSRIPPSNVNGEADK